jgi:acyl carrier protein
MFEYRSKQEVADAIRRIWAELLSAPAADIPDDGDFFRLGGYSLLALRLRSRIQSDLGIVTSLESLLHCPTLAAQVEACCRAAGSRSDVTSDVRAGQAEREEGTL